MGSEQQRPNYFVLVNFDPDRQYTDQELTDLINKQAAVWTKDAIIPSKTHEANINLRRVNDIKRVLLDAELRKLEAQNARQIKIEQRRKLQNNLEKQLAVFKDGNTISLEIITTLQKKEFAVFTIDEINSTARRLGLTVVNVADKSSYEFVTPNMLEPSLMLSIQRHLDVLDKEDLDLYKFLGLTTSTDSQQLVNRAKELYTQSSLNTNKNPVTNATSELAGYATDIFNPKTNKRQLYDNSRSEKKWNNIRNTFDMLASINRQVSAEQYDRLLIQVRNDGLDIKEAEQRLMTWATKKGVSIRVTQNLEQIQRLPQCPNCHRVDEIGQSVTCLGCGELLRVKCPSCNTENLTEHPGCKKCGFPTGSLPNVKINLRQAVHQINRTAYSDAISTLRFIQLMWPPTFDSKPLNDDITIQVHKLLTEAEASHKKTGDIIRQIAEVSTHSQYYTVRTLMAYLQDDNLTEEIKEINKKSIQAIKNAEQLLLSLHNSENRLNENEMIEQVQEILAICSDCKPAKDILAKYPPTSPSQTNVKLIGESFQVTWKASSSLGVKYCIVRNNRSRPQSINDGELVAQTIVGTSWDDRNIKIGLPTYYSVFADRNGVLSLDGSASFPILMAADVTNVRARGEDSLVTISWTPPPNVGRVMVRRSGTSPLEIQVVGNNAQDRQVFNGDTYRYQIVSIYRDHMNKDVASPGVIVTATPQVPPQAITDLTISDVGDDNTITLTWTPPPRGSVYILKCDPVTLLQAGQVYSVSGLESYGEMFQSGGSVIKFKLPWMARYFFYPLVEQNGNVVVGKLVDYVGLDEVTHLRHTLNLNTLVLQWRWPKDCHQVRVSYSFQDYPDRPNTMNRVQHDLTRADYDMSGGRFMIEKPTQQDYFFLVQTLMRRNGELLVSSGMRYVLRFANRIEVRYTVENPHWGNPFIRFGFRGEGFVPDMIIVGKFRMAPFNVEDGEQVDVFRSRDVSDATEIKQMLPKPARRPMVYRVFLKESSGYESNGGHISIVSPSKDHSMIK